MRIRPSACDRRHRRSAAVVVLPALVLAAACGAPPHVREQGAEPIAGTEGVGGLLLDTYAVSPSGRLLLFSRLDADGSPPGDPAETLAPLYGFALLDRSTGLLREVGVDAVSLEEAVEAQPALLLGSLCWADAGDVVRLGVSAGPSIVLDVRAPVLEWRLGSRPSPPDPAACPPWRPTREDLLEGAGRFLVDWREAAVRVTHRDDQARVLLEYRGSWLSRDTYVHDVRPAPGAQRLAVVVSRGTGSFTGAAELFVVSREDGDPAARALGGPVFDVRWSRRGDELFAVAAARPGAAERAIHRWSPGGARQER